MFGLGIARRFGVISPYSWWKKTKNAIREGRKTEKIKRQIKRRGRDKVFCIGLNKTGTTTIGNTLQELGYEMGNQAKAEILLKSWIHRDFRQIIEFTKGAEAFQDIPFSLPFTFQYLYSAYPNARFILTVRNSGAEWCDSITKFHSRIWANGSTIKNIREVDSIPYPIYPEFAYDFIKHVLQTPMDDPYKRDALMDFYDFHIKSVVRFFWECPGSLKIINVSKPSDYFELCDFLDLKPKRDEFPKVISYPSYYHKKRT